MKTRKLLFLAILSALVLVVMGCNTLLDPTRPPQKLDSLIIVSSPNETMIPATNLDIKNDPDVGMQTFNTSGGSWFTIVTNPGIDQDKVKLEIWDINGTTQTAKVLGVNYTKHKISGDSALVWITVKHQDADHKDGVYQITIKK